MENKPKTRQLNIAMLGHKRIPSREGGIEIVVEELATRMVEKGHNVTCYNRGGHHVSGATFDKKSVHEYKGVRIKKALTIDVKGIAAVTSSVFGAVACAFSRYDVVHFHAEGPCILCGLPHLLGKRVIVTIHGLDHKRAKWGRFASWYIMQGERAAVKYADEIIVLSKSAQDYFMSTYRRETILIPNGVNKPVNVNAQMIEEKWNLKKDSYILYLGRIVPEKGIHYLIDAYKQIDTDKKLVIAGGASDTSEYADELQKSSDKVIFTGFVEGRLLEELYSNAYLYCLPSDLEGMPLSLLEAMSYGNACLVSDIPECADVVGDKALVFRHGDVEALVKELQTACTDKELIEKYKAVSSEYICNRFNWDDVTDKTLKLYSK